MEQIIRRLVDDLDRTSPATETVRFTIDGQPFVIDLTGENAASFRDAVAPWVAIARPDADPTATTKRSRRGMSRGAGPTENTRIRQWAAQQPGIPTLSERGRIPQSVHDAYRAAQQAATQAPGGGSS
jgi:hypothetical protein